jgi:3-oxoacyl-[acyl-carrier-protein] synthase II
MGIACPLGSSLTVVAENQREGRSGAVPLASVFDAPALPVLACARVPDWATTKLAAPFAGAMAGRADRKSEFGLWAATEAVRDAFGDEERWLHTVAAAPERVGLHLASGLVSTPVEEADRDVLPCIDERGAYDFAEAGRRLRSSSPYRARHMTDRVHHLLSWRWGLQGPSLVNHGACAAAAVAIGTAARWIREGRCEVAVAGGFEGMIHPFGVLSFQMLGALSERQDCAPDAVSRPFDRSRDGFLLGEGGAALVLESPAHARARGARARGRILGLGTSLDAYRATAPPPDGRGAADAMRAALREAGLSPEQVGYLNAHGTGTPLNDAAESRAIHTVFGTRAPPVSSSKSMLGHTVAAAGAVETVLTLLALGDGVLPPTRNLHDPDPDCDLDHIALVARPARARVAMSNSFGFGGVNASLVLGGAP